MEFENLLKLINAVSSSSLTELEYEERDVKLSLKKDIHGQVTAVNTDSVNQGVSEVSEVMTASVLQAEIPAAVSSVNADSAEPEGNIMKSPLVGTFYVAPSEDAEPFVKVGDKVEKGQILAIVEAMKLMNDIESDFAGEVAEVYVQNGDVVEYGQPLFRIK